MQRSHTKLKFLARGLKIEEIFKPFSLTPPSTLRSRNNGPVPPWCLQCFLVLFLLTSYYRRRGIPSILTPGAPSPLFTPVSMPRPSLPLDHPHFDVARRVNTLVVTSKPNLPNPGHGYGFGAGDFHSTRTWHLPTHAGSQTHDEPYALLFRDHCKLPLS